MPLFTQSRPGGAVLTIPPTRTLAILAIFACSAAAASKWIRVSSPSIEISTDCSESTARAVLNHFETLRNVFRTDYASDARVRVFLFSSEREFEKYRSDPAAAGFYRNEDGDDLIILPESSALKRIAAHEYLHMVMHHASPFLPRWLDEGLAEFYSTLSINGAKMRIGETIPAHLSLLSHEPWLNAEDLALGSPADGRIFYAESWALVHMLSLTPPWREKMPEFVKLLSQGQKQDEAFPAAFGISMEEAVSILHLSLHKLGEITSAAPPKQTPEPVQSASMTPLEATLALGDLALRTQHEDLARSLFQKAKNENPQSPGAIAGLGALALAEDRRDDARREFERAIALGYRDANTTFQLAALTHDNALLEKTVAIDPNFAEAHFLLGVRATDDGNFASAVEHLRDATALQPRRFSYWHALSYAQAKSGDRQAAAESARRASVLARTDTEEKMAASLSLLASESPLAARVKKPDVIVPPSWQNRKGDARIEGTLTNVDCAADPVRLDVSASAKTFALTVRNPAEVELVNADGVSTTLVCGQQSLPVVVEYIDRSHEITRIEFKRVVIIKR
jgi:tetratricopeptide (TPR) repeat protein